MANEKKFKVGDTVKFLNSNEKYTIKECINRDYEQEVNSAFSNLRNDYILIKGDTQGVTEPVSYAKEGELALYI